MKIYKKSVLVLTLASVVLLNGCDKIKSYLPNQSQNNQSLCHHDAVKQQVQQLVAEKIGDMSKNALKAIVNEGVEVDITQLGKMAKTLNVTVDDVRTEQADAKSKKHQCVASVSIQIPSAMVEEANQTRKIDEEEFTVEKSALLADLKFDNNTITSEFLYKAQPSDDGKKYHVSVESGHVVSRFVSDVIVDALLKPTAEQRQRQYEEAVAEEERILAKEAEEEEKKQAEKDKTKAEYQAVLEKEAQQNLDKANADLNLVWNDAEAEIREELLPEQRVWLKKRELECKLKAQEEEMEDERNLVRIQCEEKMTKQRTPELKASINNLRKALQE